MTPFPGGLAPLGVCVLLAALSAAVVRGMIGLAVMDVPGARSAHARPVPRGGGAGLVAAILAGVPALLALQPAHGAPDKPWWRTGVLLGAVALLAGVCWVDDRRGLRPGPKFLAQAAASVLAMAAAWAGWNAVPGGVPGAIAAGMVALGWMLFVVNAANFIDGLNGLAAGSTALCGALACVLATGSGMGGAFGLATAAGLAGFLPFNYPKARIFMGDIGSQVCGLVVGVLPLLALRNTAGTGTGWRIAIEAALPVPLMFAGILWDVLFTLGRRFLAGERLTQAHRGHLYQVAARCWLPPTAVAALYWGFVAWGAAMAVSLRDRPVAAAAGTMLPPLCWTVLVAARARRTGIGRWS
ncbi:MAG: hypothetical protein INR65_14935 [Gluconacetobacter diazotrophicus]|nr:hypothetical protein [Gluconacetobacter diazotrophicus]